MLVALEAEKVVPLASWFQMIVEDVLPGVNLHPVVALDQRGLGPLLATIVTQKLLIEPLVHEDPALQVPS